MARRLLGNLCSRTGRLVRWFLRYEKGAWQGALVDAILHAPSVVRVAARLTGAPLSLLRGPDSAHTGMERHGDLAGSGIAIEASPASLRAGHGGGQVEYPGRSSGDCPAIRWREHLDVRIPAHPEARRTAWLRRGDRIVVEPPELEVFHFSTYSLHVNAIAVSRNRALVRNSRSSERLSLAVYPGSFAPGNWYHWLIEALPRIWLSDRLPDEFRRAPLLLHIDHLKSAAAAESMEALAIDREIHFFGREEGLDVERMIWIDGAFSLRHHALAPDGSIDHRSRFHPVMREFRRLLLSTQEHEVVGLPRLVFLDRRAAARSYNRDAVRSMLSERGFVAIDPSELSFSEQMALFSSAETLVGPTGAAWANLLFADSDVKALYWTPERFAGGQVWSSLAAVAGASVHELTYPQVGSFKTDEYRLDVNLLSAQVDKLLG